MRKVIALLVILLGIVATGCEYEAPLAEKQGLPIDNSVLGLWEEITPERKPNPKSRMKISRYSETEYLVRYFGGKESLYFRGYPIKIAGVSCIQIQWFRTWEESIGKKSIQEKGGGGFLVISYEVLDGDLVIKVLNTGVVSNKLKSSSELRTAFLRHKDNKDLFTNPARFRKVNLNATRQEELGDALIDASKKGDVATVRNLLAKGADVNAKDSKGYTALDYASVNGHMPVVQILLSKGTDVNAKDNDGWTALMFASFEGQIAVLEALLAKGANPNVKNKAGVTALMYAALKGHLPVVQSLLAKGADVNTKDNDGNTALMRAALEGHLPIVQALLAKGADVNAKTEEGNTALDFASHEAHTAVVAALRKAMNKPCPANLSAEHVFQLNGRVRTGVVIKRGDRITFSASGRVSFGVIAGAGGPEGINGFRGYNSIRGADIQHGALIARIKQQYANDGWYYIGEGRTIRSNVDGTLELGVNDSDASNNRGLFTVEVSICRAR